MSARILGRMLSEFSKAITAEIPEVFFKKSRRKYLTESLEEQESRLEAKQKFLKESWKKSWKELLKYFFKKTHEEFLKVYHQKF